MSRILITMLSPLNYGATRMGAEYALALRRRGHDVLVVHAREISTEADRLRSCVPMLQDAEIEIRCSPGILRMGPFPPGNTLVKIAREWQADVLISNQLRDAPSTIRAAKKLRLPGIVFALNSPQFSGSPGMQRFKRWAYRRTVRDLAAHVVCCAEGVAREMKDLFGVPVERITVAPNGIDLDALPETDPRCRDEIRRELGLTDELLLVNLARIEAQKGHEYLLEAARLLKESGTCPAFRIVIAGGAESDRAQALLQRLQSFVTAHQLERHVQFLGFRSDGFRLLQAADGFVLSSVWEGLPLAVLEAFAARCPVVMADYGDRFKNFRDDVDGIYTDSCCGRSLADGIRRVLTMSSAERQRMGEAGRVFVEANLTLRHGSELFCNAVEQVLGHCGKRCHEEAAS